jgi:hypothetical protein
LLASKIYFARLNRQLADGSWEASADFTFTTISCRTPLASEVLAPGVVEFNMRAGSGPGWIPSRSEVEFCGPGIFYARTTLPNAEARRALVISWYFNGSLAEMQSAASLITVNLGLTLARRHEGVPGEYLLKLEFGSAAPPLEATIRLVC